MDLTGCIDTHVHSGPDVRERRTTSVELVRAACDARMRAVLLKNHHTSTAPLAAALTELFPGIQVCGGLVLNHAVGGLNTEAVEAALKMGARQIWMPTLSAECERVYRGRAGTGLTAAGAATLNEILRLIAKYDAILGTGHLFPQESLYVVRLAREAGVRRILVTHPEINFVRMDIGVQQALRGDGLFFERCFCRDGFSLSWDEMAARIREMGVEDTILATDLGQPENPHPVEGLSQFADEMLRRGFSESELRRMMATNPSEVLGL